MLSPRRALLLALVGAMAAGCGASVPSGTPTPTGSGAAPTVGASTPGSAAEPQPWRPAVVPRNDQVADPPTLQPGYQCHPCHNLAENLFLGVGTWPEGFIAVGVQQPPATAIAFTSSDGLTWAPVDALKPVDDTTGIAVASIGPRTVIVGHGPDGAASWATTGGAWVTSASSASLAAPSSAASMLAVIPFGSGFVAGGYRDNPETTTASAAVWRSSDGVAWQLDNAGGAFDGGRIWGLAAKDGTIVAVGTSGNPVYGPAAAWRWTTATGWVRATLTGGNGGAMHAVTATPDGFVAVGLSDQDTGGRVWTSTDGQVWTPAADGPAFHYFDLAVRMQAVTQGPSGIVAGGWRSDGGKGSGVAWTASPLASGWVGPTWEAAFSGGEITGVAAKDGTVVAVGRLGYPDWNYAAAWRLAQP